MCGIRTETRFGSAVQFNRLADIRSQPTAAVEFPHGLKAKGAILCDQIKSLDWRARRATRLESVPDPVMQEVTARILVLVDPPE